MNMTIKLEFDSRPNDVEYVTLETLACGQTAAYYSAQRGGCVRCIDSAYVTGWESQTSL